MIDPRDPNAAEFHEPIDPSRLTEAQRFAVEMIALRNEPELRQIVAADLAEREWSLTRWHDFVADVIVEVFGTFGALEKLHPESGRLLDEVVRAATEPHAIEGEPTA